MTETNEVQPLSFGNIEYHHGGTRARRETRCGIGRFTPGFLQVFARIGAFVGIYSASGFLTSTLAVYINSQVPTLEKQFGFSSAQTGFLMACNDIGFLCTAMLAGYLTNKVHIPRGLALSTMFYGVCGLLCALPHFIQDPSRFDIDPSTSNTNVTRSRGRAAPICNTANATASSQDGCSASSEEGAYNLEQLWINKMAFALIAIGMIFQGIGKSPRYPFLSLYIDDNGDKRKTGFYMGIVVSTGVFGPVLAYFLGGVFSKIYVTLTAVSISPYDPRWIGAWWLGFLLFGISAVIFALPLMFFPKKLPFTRHQSAKKHHDKNMTMKHVSKRKSTFKVFIEETKDYGKSLLRIFSNPVYTLMNAATVFYILGVAGAWSFKPKYIASQYSVPLWQANMVMAGCSILSVAIGAFVGGIVTRRIKMSPLNTCKMLLLFYTIYIATQVMGFFLGCEQPTLYGDNDLHQSSPLYTLTAAQCNTDCQCDDNAYMYFPICGDDGRSYFSPCHAGCSSSGSKDFSNCTCIETGHAVAGVCGQDCGTQLYIYAVATFVGKLATSCKIIPVFIGKLRSVEERDRAVATASQSFITSVLGWMPGPVIFGAIIDNTCLLWKYTCGERQSCKLYDIVYFRNVLHGYSVVTTVLAALMIFIIYVYFKVTGKNVWLSEELKVGQAGQKPK